MEHYYEVGTADSISASERSPDAPGRETVPFSGKHDRPVTPVWDIDSPSASAQQMR